jgi:predicted metal-dependent peptidase
MPQSGSGDHTENRTGQSSQQEATQNEAQTGNAHGKKRSREQSEDAAHEGVSEIQSTVHESLLGKNDTAATSSEEEKDQNQTHGAPQPLPLTECEKESLQVQWQQRMAGAAQQAMQAGKLGGDIRRMVDHLLQPQLPWRSLLAHYVTCVARDDYSYSRPNARRGDPAIYPSLRSDEVDMVVVLDTSGSIANDEMNEFIAEVNAIKSQIRARIIFQVCDATLSDEGPWIYESWENFEMPKQFDGGGATDFSPVFNWLDRQDRQPQLLVYFTDAEGSFPQKPPIFPVIWLVKGKAKVPWGQRVQLN